MWQARQGRLRATPHHVLASVQQQQGGPWQALSPHLNLPCLPPPCVCLPFYLPQKDRIEAASLLERTLAAMEAMLTARRQVAIKAVEAVKPVVPDFMQPPPSVSGWAGAAEREGKRAESE